MSEDSVIQRPPLPTLHILFDAERQAVGIGFESAEFRSWPFIVGVLEMALAQARLQANMAMMQALQQQQVEAQLANHIVRNHKKGH